MKFWLSVMCMKGWWMNLGVVFISCMVLMVNWCEYRVSWMVLLIIVMVIIISSLVMVRKRNMNW